jgi:single-strand DNA-binding protein
MNKIILIGNLTKDPEIRVTQSGLKTANFALAINDGKDKNGQEQVQYFNLSAFDKQADLIEKYVKKGHKVMVAGRARNESWDKPDGTKGYGFKVIANEIELLTSKTDAERINSMMPSTPSDDTSSDSSSKPAAKKAPIKDDDLPEIDISNINVQMPF